MIAFMLAIFSLNPESEFTYLFFSILTFVLILCGSDSSQFFRWLFANKIVMFLGMISYGIYLCHVPLLVILERLNLISSEDPGLTL